MSEVPEEQDISLREKLSALAQVAAYRPRFAAGIILLSFLTALLEGVGLSFLIPIINIAQGTAGTDPNGVERVFLAVYRILDISLTLETVIVAVGLVMIARYTASFLVEWLQAAIRTDYIRHLQTVVVENALDAQVSYYDTRGTDDVLNAIVTQSEYAGNTIRDGVRLIKQGFISLVYFGVALYIAPVLTIATGVFLGGGLYLIRSLLESGYSVGDRVADANERVQRAVQAGVQGIREIKLFGLGDEMFDRFETSVDQFADSQIRFQRNRSLIKNAYELITAISVFGLIYFALRVASLTLASLGVFLFAMFRLSPRASTLNTLFYRLEGNLPHLIRTQQFVTELKAHHEPDEKSAPPPDPLGRITFHDVTFAYEEERVLDHLTFEVEPDEFVAFVGTSGAGKSTIVALLTRLYRPDGGQITVSGTDIQQFDLSEWRERIAVVRQNPYIFNETLRANITVGNRDASEAEIREVCEIAQVTEFLDSLPAGLDTELGDQGVRLSGGQRQRVAIARALLKPADLLILDEATSDLDSNIESRVHDAVESMDRDYTIIVIAHRLSTVINADCIYTMEDGSITEAGSHRELINRDGTYADLYETQT